MIEIENLTKRYNGKAAVDNVSMTVEARSVTAIVGTSGSGKTTLLRMINRLEEPSEGRILIDGVDNRTVQGYELRRRIGYAIQGYGLFPHRTVAQNIATVPVLLGWEAGRIKTRVEELLSLFQLDPSLYGPRYPHELSGGQQQRVGVARGLAAEPNILLMDEPFGALDAIIRTKAREDLLDIQKQLGITIILVTHDIEEAIQLGNMIAVMDAGKLVQHATPADILTKPANAFVEELVGSAERPFRLLSLESVRDAVEPGDIDGPPVPLDISKRDALGEMLWSGRTTLPVQNKDGTSAGHVTLDALARRASRPV